MCVSNVEQQLIGSDTKWDQIAIVRYPSRQAFVSMLERPDFQQLSVHKDAGVEKSTVLVTESVDLPPFRPWTRRRCRIHRPLRTKRLR